MLRNMVSYNPARKYNSEVNFTLLHDGYYETTVSVFDKEGFAVGTVIMHEYEKLKPEMIKKIERLIISINEKAQCL